MENSLLEMIYQDMEESLPAHAIQTVRAIYRVLCQGEPSEAAAQVALLMGITERISPDIHQHMCRQRGYDPHTSFSSRLQMICYTSAEFARERYDVTDKVYTEIRRFADADYTSAVKTEASQILRSLLQQ